eukprot:scaffold1041_cov124-Isochrysis_galbana.AAC.14
MLVERTVRRMPTFLLESLRRFTMAYTCMPPRKTPASKTELDDRLHRGADGVVREREGLDHLAAVAHVLPRRAEVEHGHALHKVGRADLELLQLVLVVVPGLVGVAGRADGRVDVLDDKLERARDRADGHAIHSAQAGVGGAGRAKGQRGARHLRLERQASHGGEVKLHRDVGEELVLERVVQREGQDDVRRVDVLHARHLVLGPNLRQRRSLGRGEARPHVHELGHPREQVGLLDALARAPVRRRCGRGRLLGACAAVDAANRLARLLGLCHTREHLGVDDHVVEPKRFLRRGRQVVSARRLEGGERDGQRLEQRLCRLASERGVGVEAAQQSHEEDGAVAHLVVVVVQAALQQDCDGRAEVGNGDAKLGQRGDGRGAYGGVLQHDAVVDEPDIFGRLLRARALDAEKEEDLRRQQRKLTVLDELAQVRQAGLLGLGHARDDDEQGVHDGLLVLEAALLAQHVCEEGHEEAVLVRELEAHGPDGVHDDDLEVVGDLRHEGRDLLHKPLNARLGAAGEGGGRCGVSRRRKARERPARARIQRSGLDEFMGGVGWGGAMCGARQASGGGRASGACASHVLSKVVMASVAMDRFESLISPSMSMLHGVTAIGCAMATLFSVRTAEKRQVGLGEQRKSCRTVMDGESSRCPTDDSEQMAVAAS